MADLPRYHLGEQHAPALLRPIWATLRDLEARTHHYRARLHLHSPADQAALEAAEQALGAARATLERLARPVGSGQGSGIRDQGSGTSG